jgi:pimeloyl-ACP methyl ester carboxylesterase
MWLRSYPFCAPGRLFSRSHRTVSVDLRGHGRSDAPYQDYTMAAFADDLAWLCSELGVIKPIVVGHGMGGNVALLDDRYSSLVRSESRLPVRVKPTPRKKT